MCNFFVTVVIGALLRYNTVFPVESLAVRNWIHAHSHTGFLGWIFIAIMTIAYATMLPKDEETRRKVYRLLVLVQLSVVGMLVTFPISGYAASSIIFSSMHMLLSVLLTIFCFKNTDKGDLSVRYVRTALIFMLVSSIGPLMLGPIIAMGMKGTEIYDLAVYFYLHFQYNGWFTIAIFGLFIKMIDVLGFPMKEKNGKIILKLLIISAILTLSLSALGFEPYWYLRLIGFVGVAIQLYAGFFFLRIVFLNIKLARRVESKLIKWFFGIALFSWLLKIMMQFLSVIPIVTDFAYFNREAIMFYLHLTFLGFASVFLVGFYMIRQYLWYEGKVLKMGYILLLVSIVLMELTIGLKALPQFFDAETILVFNKMLLFESILVVLSLLIIMILGIKSYRTTRSK